MADAVIHPSRLAGELTIPSSKSQTLRAMLFGALGRGASRITAPLESPDSDAMLAAVEQLGARVVRETDAFVIHGMSGQLRVPDDVIHCGNSGIVLRFIGALAGLIPHYTVLTGDASIRERRPAGALLEGLTQLGAFAHATRDNGFAPLVIRGPFTRRAARVIGYDSQPVSGLLIAGALSPLGLDLSVEKPGETPWVELTLDWLHKLGIPCTHNGTFTRYELPGNARIGAFDYHVPGDLSTAAFPIVAALITDSELTLHNVDLHDLQGDRHLFEVLKQMGARLSVDAERRMLTVLRGSSLSGQRIDVGRYVDALPILAVLGTFAAGRTELIGGQIARHKESDRIGAMVRELRKMGALIEETSDGLVVHRSELKGATLETHQDHRIVLSLAVAALRARSSSTLGNIEWAAKTFAGWQSTFRRLGARIE